jgi:hypothetical protein
LFRIVARQQTGVKRLNMNAAKDLRFSGGNLSQQLAK